MLFCLDGAQWGLMEQIPAGHGSNTVPPVGRRACAFRLTSAHAGTLGAKQSQPGSQLDVLVFGNAGGGKAVKKKKKKT